VLYWPFMPRRRLRSWLPPIALLAAAACSLAAPRPPLQRLLPTDPPVRRLAPTGAHGKFEGDLEARLRSAPAERRFTVLVDLTEQMDLGALRTAILADPRPRPERRADVIALFERLAARQQAGLLDRLESWIDEGRLDYVRPVAIVNRLIVEGRPEGILALAELPEVASVLEEWRSRRIRGSSETAATPIPAGESFTSWAIEAMGADVLWKQGLDGAGIVVAAIDTGVRPDHEQLAGRSLAGDRGWFDPVRGSSLAFDSEGHGTSVLSQAVGANPEGRVVGVAPSAAWAMALGNYENFYSRVRMTLAADWVMRVARPDVLVNAWSHDEDPCGRFDMPFIDAWKATGVFVVFPAGNRGPAPATGDSPAQLSGTFPDGGPVLAVAGLAPDGGIHEGSSRGPSVCGSRRFPSLAGPGARLPVASHLSPTAYYYGDGTSLAAGLLAGAAALLLQADRALEPWELERILLETATDLPPAGDDDAAGAGSVWLPAALERVRSRHG